MINLSTGGANEDGIFLHADVKAANAEQKRENNPMHSSRACDNNDLLIIRILFDPSGKTGA
jgi:hypothetical protein